MAYDKEVVRRIFNNPNTELKMEDYCIKYRFINKEEDWKVLCDMQDISHERIKSKLNGTKS